MHGPMISICLEIFSYFCPKDSIINLVDQPALILVDAGWPRPDHATPPCAAAPPPWGRWPQRRRPCPAAKGPYLLPRRKPGARACSLAWCGIGGVRASEEVSDTAQCPSAQGQGAGIGKLKPNIALPHRCSLYSTTLSRSY